MAFKLRVLSISDRLSRNLPVLLLLLVIVFSFNSAIFFDQALSGWFRSDRLSFWVSSATAALSMFAVIVNSVSLFASIRRTKANG